MKHTHKLLRPAYAAVIALVLAGTAVQAETYTSRPKVTRVALANGTVEVGEGAQSDDHLFDGADRIGAKAKGSNEVSLDKSMLGLAASKGGGMADLAKKLDSVTVRDYEFANAGDYNMADVQAIVKRLDGDGWKHIVRSREGKELTDICIRQDANGTVKEMVIVDAEPKEVSLVHLRGNVGLGDMQNFGNMMRGTMKGDSKGQSSSDSKGATNGSKTPGGGGEAQSTGALGNAAPIEGAPDGSGAASVGRQPKS